MVAGAAVGVAWPQAASSTANVALANTYFAWFDLICLNIVWFPYNSNQTSEVFIQALAHRESR